MMKELKIGMERRGREWRSPSLFYADDLVLYGKSEEYQRAMVRHFLSRGLKVNAHESKVMLLREEEGLEGEVSVNGV